MAELPSLENFANVAVTAQHLALSDLGLVYMGPNVFAQNHWCALKTVRPELLSVSPRVRDRFVREALIWCGLWPHANLLTTQTVDKFTCDIEFSDRPEFASGQPFLVLDYAEGACLRNLLALPHNFATRLFWAECIAAGLLALHTPDPDLLRPEPLAHGDLKPENVLILNNGRAVLSACTLAKAIGGDTAALTVLSTLPPPPTRTSGEPQTAAAVAVEAAIRCRPVQTSRGPTLGALAYLAPEQWEEATPSAPAADLYAFGILLSELLSGQHALLDLEQPHSEEAWRQAHLSGLPHPLRHMTAEVPPSLENLYQALLAKHPEQRPTAQEALATLQATADHLGLQGYEVSEVYPRTPERQSMRWHDWAMAHHYFGFDAEALKCNEQALTLAPHHYGFLTWRTDILHALAAQAEEQGQMTALQAHIDQLLATYDALQAEIPATNIQALCELWVARAAALQQGQRHAEAEAVLSQVTALAFAEEGVVVYRALNQLRWGMAEAHAGRGQEAVIHYQQGLEFIARALVLSDGRSEDLEIQAKLQQALAEESSRAGITSPLSPGDPS